MLSVIAGPESFVRYRDLVSFEAATLGKHAAAALGLWAALVIAYLVLGRFPGVARLGSAGASEGRAAVFYPLAASLIGLRWPLESPGPLYSALSLTLGAVYPFLLRSLGNAPRRELAAITTGAVLTVGWLNFCFRHAWLKTEISPVECLCVGETVALCAVVWKWLSSRRRLSTPYNLAALGASVAVLWLYPARFAWRDFASLLSGPSVQALSNPAHAFQDSNPQGLDANREGLDAAQNILLITIDTLRADALSLYDERNQTPHIDQLGREGVVFEQAQVQAPFTLASMVSMFSGWYPEALKTAANTYYIPDHHTLLAKKLARKGYRTASIVANPILSPSIGIQQGFADVTIVREDKALPNTSRYVTDLAIRFLQDTSARPFLLWVHYYDPHAPYDPPAEYRTLAYEGPLPARVNEFTKRAMYLPPSDLEYVKSLYLGDVRFVDNEVGRLLEALRTRESYDKTVIVLTSDHGEEHYDHGGMWHGHTMYQELLRVPLILKGPSLPQAKRVRDPVELIGLMPTLEGLLGLEQVGEATQAAAAPFTGVLLESRASHGKAFEYAEHTYYGEPQRAVRLGGFKLIERMEYPKFELYNLAADPAESRNLYWNMPAKVRELKGLLRDISELNRKLLAEQRVNAPPELEDETRQRLRSLGYVQ